MRKVLFTITVLFLLAAFGVSAFMVGNYLIEGKEQEDRYNELASIAQGNDTRPPVTTTETPWTQPSVEPTEEKTITKPGMLSGYEALYEMNSDFVGWLSIPGTQLDYPVMQTPQEPNFYLYRDFDKNDSARGSIYAREDCNINEPSDNITLYGHNMKDGSMFAALNNYVYKETWEDNSLIFFDTLTEYHTYKIFAVFTTSANLGEGFRYHVFVDAESEAEFDEFVKTCKDLSFYDTGITPVYGDKLICLSTCEYSHDNGRLVVAAVRIT